MEEDTIKRSDAIKHFKAKADHYRKRLARIEAQGDAIGYDPTEQINGFKDEIAIYDSFVKELDDIPSAEPCEDTISRAFILAELSDLADEFSELDENGLHNDRWCGIMDSKGVVSKAPSILSNRSAAEWIMSDDGIICSKCKKHPAFIDSYEFPIPVMEWHSDFCPNCGARMAE